MDYSNILASTQLTAGHTRADRRRKEDDFYDRQGSSLYVTLKQAFRRAKPAPEPQDARAKNPALC